MFAAEVVLTNEMIAGLVCVAVYVAGAYLTAVITGINHFAVDVEDAFIRAVLWPCLLLCLLVGGIGLVVVKCYVAAWEFAPNAMRYVGIFFGILILPFRPYKLGIMIGKALTKMKKETRNESHRPHDNGLAEVA